jgi:hypothetical protein
MQKWKMIKNAESFEWLTLRGFFFIALFILFSECLGMSWRVLDFELARLVESDEFLKDVKNDNFIDDPMSY